MRHATMPTMSIVMNKTWILIGAAAVILYACSEQKKDSVPSVPGVVSSSPAANVTPVRPALGADERAKKISQATSGMKFKRDKMESVSFYTDKNRNLFSTRLDVYLSIPDGRSAYLRVRPTYYSSDWVFFKRIKVMADDVVVYEKETPSPVHDNSGGYVWETADYFAESDDLIALRAIASAKKVTVRFSGREHYDDHDMKAAEIANVRNMLKALDALAAL